MDCCLLPQSLKTSREIARGQNCPQTSSFEFLNIGGLDSIKFLSEFLCFTNLLLLYYLNFKYESDKIALSKYLQRSTRSSNATEGNDWDIDCLVFPNWKLWDPFYTKGFMFNSCSNITWDPWVLLELFKPSKVSRINLDPQFHFTKGKIH